MKIERMKRGLGATLIGALLMAQGAIADALPDWSTLFEKNKEAVVSITTKGRDVVETNPFRGFFDFPFGDDPFGGLFGESPLRQERQIRGAGSGFILEEDGLVVTNAHVIEKADEITVHLADRRELTAELVGKDDRSDVAVLRIKAKDLPAVKIGDVSELKVGQWVMAVGSPFGFDYTATQGIISSIGRNLPNDHLTPFIQTDAAVNPGNSGGPLFNTKGEVIGINSQIYTSTGNYAGVSFAIPIDLAMEVVEQLKTDGKVSRGWLGVSIQEVTAPLAKSFKMDRPKGALVANVVAGSPAEKGGIKAGDVILKFNGQEVLTSSQVPAMVSRVRANQTVDVVVLRSGKEQTLKVEIQALDSDQIATALPQDSVKNRLDIVVESVKDGQGVVITQVAQGVGAQAGLRSGDILLQINDTEIKNAADFNRAMELYKSEPVLRLLMNRNGTTTFIAITLPTEKK